MAIGFLVFSNFKIDFFLDWQPDGFHVEKRPFAAFSEQNQMKLFEPW